MSRKKINLLMIRPAVGWPGPGETVRVELTDQVQAVLDQGLAVDLGDDDAQVPAELDQDNEPPTSQPAVPNREPDTRDPDDGHGNRPADPPTRPDEQTAPDGSTVLPAKKQPARKAAAKKAAHNAG